MVEYLEIGHIMNTHGLKGELKVRPLTDDITRYEELKKVWIAYRNDLEEHEVESVRYQNDIVLLKLKDIDDINIAEKYKNCYLKIHRNDTKQLSQNEYYIADLIGCDVYEKELLGTLDDIFSTGSNDVYVIKREGKRDLLLPALASVIKKVDVENRRIDVEVPRGLEDEI